MPHRVKDRTGARMNSKQMQLRNYKLDDGGACDGTAFNFVR